MNLEPSSSFWAVFFWINAVACVVLGILFARKLEEERKQLKDAFKDHYLKRLRWLFRHELKEHGIDEETQNNGKSKNDLN